MSSAPPTIGVDIGGTKIAGGVLDQHGEVLASAHTATPHDSAAGVAQAIADMVATLGDQVPTADGLGIAAAGFLNRDRSMIRFSPHVQWRDEALPQTLISRMRPDLVDRFCGRIVLDNDANTAAWAEYRLGAGLNAERMVAVCVGTGIGVGTVSHGVLDRGTQGMAGEWGHMTVVFDGEPCPCGRRGCWEQYASGEALGRSISALERTDPPLVETMRIACDQPTAPVSGRLVTAAARAGDPTALALCEDLALWLARGVVTIIAGLDPDVVVIGGGLSEVGDLLLDPVKAHLATHVPGRGWRELPTVLLAQRGSAASWQGAALLAADRPRCDTST